GGRRGAGGSMAGQAPRRHRGRHADAPHRRGVGRTLRRAGRGPVRVGAPRRARSVRPQGRRPLLRPARLVPSARAGRRDRGACPRWDEQAQDPPRQPIASDREIEGQRHAATPRSGPRRCLLSPRPRSAAETQRQAARGARSVRGRIQGPRHAIDLGLPRTDEKARHLMAAAYWELAVPAPDEVAEALTNFLWELGALGVVEEQVAGGAPMLRAFFPSPSEAALLAARVRTYTEGLRALGLAAPDAPTVRPLADADWG